MNWGLFSRVAVSLSVVLGVALSALGYVLLNIDRFSPGDVTQMVILVLAGTWLFAVIVLLVTLRYTMKPLSLLTELITSTSFDGPRREISEDLRTSKGEVGALACAFDAMVANLQKSYEELGERELHYRQLVETANVIPWELDLNTRRITYVGPQATGILGYPQDDWHKEKFWLEHVHHKDRHLAENFYRRVAAGKGGNEIEYRMLHASGSVVWVRDWVHYSLKNSRTPVLQGFMFDISEQVSTREELRQYREHLENLVEEQTAELVAANQELQTFAHSISQDLRVPLRIINGFSQALMEDYEGVVDEEGKDNLRRICAGTKRMGKMIDDLLILSRVTRQEMQRQKFDMSNLVQRINAKLQQFYPGREVNCIVQPGVVGYGDKNLLQIVFENLLSNAWKYTAKVDVPQITFSMHEANGKTIYTVSDNGAGFDMRYVDKLFSPFKRLHNSEEFEGTGVGLATVQRIILRHGGEVWGKGVVNKGAEFSFTLSGKSSLSLSTEKNSDEGHVSSVLTTQ